MLESLMIEEGNRQISDEYKSLETLRAKMESIKKSAVTLNNDRTKTISHDQAIHAGDYYMFADDYDTKILQLEDSSIDLQKPTKNLSEHDDMSSDQTTPTLSFKQSIKKLLFGLLVSMVRRMQKLSRKYRFIIQVLALEKKTLKEEHLTESINANDKT